MVIERNEYINKLMSKRWNGKVKIITGIRRCGKSFLLNTLFKQKLIEENAGEVNFVEIALDRKSHLKYRNPNLLYEYVIKQTKDKSKKYYVMIDEIQLSYKVKNEDIDESVVPEEDQDMLYTTFYDVLNDLMSHPNLDIYVTGSNSKMLSNDIVTNFRDRGSEIRVYPLSFDEYLSYSGLDKADAFEQYLMYGGMPLAVLEEDENEKRKYLQDLFHNVYIKDIVERYKLKDDAVLSALVDALSSSVGSLTNPHKLACTAATLLDKSTSDHTIKNYLDYLEDAFLFKSAKRYDVKGRKHFSSIQKYYSIDLGLRNARLNFRQQERSHLMENMLYNEIIRRGYSVDVGVVEVERMVDGKRKQGQYEIDFVVNVGNEKVYIQSALNVDTPEKKDQETFSLHNTADFFRKFVVLDGNQKMWTDDDGVIYVGVIPFLLNDYIRV
ncbi:MAG: ATP-binding protein [Bacteroidales bacterium]|nr:ATP-binding protein [Bacteroidales bacterium]